MHRELTDKSTGLKPLKQCHPFFERFDRIYVINLKSRLDRRREIGKQLERVGLSFDNPRVRLFEAIRPLDRGDFPTVGSRGCFMSHYRVLVEASSLGSVLIIEDDLDFVEDIDFALDQAHDAFPEEWSMFYGGIEVSGADSGPLRFVQIPPDEAIVTTHFVGMTGDCILKARQLLAEMLQRPAGDPRGGPMHVDGAYSWLRRINPSLSTWATAPRMGFQRPSRTDIHALAVSDKIPIVRELKQCLRRIIWPSP